MKETIYILVSFLCFVGLTVFAVLNITRKKNQRVASTFRFKFYNPLSYKTLDSEKGAPNVVNYYANPNHSVLSEIVWFTPENQTKTLYQESDFRNGNGIAPAYWNYLNQSTSNCSSYDFASRLHGVEVGPCFAPHHEVNWTMEIQKTKVSGNTVFYHDGNQSSFKIEDWSNYCRPGFIIIGAGKCGTSSLYHYLTDHPRILPAREKQIHYFKFYPNNSLKWYFDHFPTSVSFLSNGALLTGEASPGYLPYPDVAIMIRNRMTNLLDENLNKDVEAFDQPTTSCTKLYVGPKIITVGREPVDRAYSSYKYNYVTPTIGSMRLGRFPHIPKDLKKEKPDSFYEKYLFTFEEMVLAELQVLKECLSVTNGTAIVGAEIRWGNQTWIKDEYTRRKGLGLPPMAAIDEYCYGEVLKSTVPKRQWIELKEKYPEKVIDEINVHLKQAIVGRGLYVLPLEWWYSVFPKEELFFVCTEELSDRSGTGLNQLGDFLGLPPDQYNFSESVSAGAYNVAGYRGYDEEVPLTVLENKVEIPLSVKVREQLDEFIRPYNERLFQLVGRRCDW